MFNEKKYELKLSFHWPIKFSLASKCISLNSKPGLARPTHIDLNLNELLYYTLTVSLGRCNGSCTLDDPYHWIYNPNKKIVNFNDANIITKINESKTSTQYVLYGYKCKFNGKKCNSNQKWNNKKSWCKGKCSIKNPKC